MADSDAPLPTLNLKMGENLFPVKKTRLLKNLVLFQRNPSLLADDYEVQTKVPVPIFEDFLKFLNRESVPLSEENCGSLLLLADELRFVSLSEKCRRFLNLQQSIALESKNDRVSDGSELGIGPGHRVTINAGGRTKTFEVLDSLKQIYFFAIALREANENGILIDGVEGSDRIAEKAVAAVYSNAVAKLPNFRLKKPLLVLTLWELGRMCFSHCIEAAMYCWNRLNEIAPSGFDKARFLLLSQCDPRYPDDFRPLPNANWTIIGTAVETLKAERNGKRAEADELLRRLKDRGFSGTL